MGNSNPAPPRIFALFLLVLIHGRKECMSKKIINRSSFPDGFVFGTGTSAFQVEGALKEDGRGPSIWDKFSHISGKISDSSNADVAVDQYNRYQEDVQLMKDMGMDAYRFSISWPRIFPNGTGQINQAGIDHYNKLINALLAKGIQPYVTLYHWDLPQALQDKYNGWLSRKIIHDFGVYAETCFQNFGDRVKHWTTINEMHAHSMLGYAIGLTAPGRCSKRASCRAGNSDTEPYVVGHNFLLSHATASDIYRRKFKAKQRGSIGVSFDVMWFEPETNTTEDIEAAQRAQDFQLGWFLDPLMFGDYPSSMKQRVGKRLPKFTRKEANLVKGSLDFVGINHYTTNYAKKSSNNLTESCEGFLGYCIRDSGAITGPSKGGKPIGERANLPWLYIVPRGIRSLMNYIKNKYGNPLVLITENGMDEPDNPSIPLKSALKDDKRISYHFAYLKNLLAAIRKDGCNVQGYFVWSLLDNWEWAFGFSSRFGLYFVDYKDNLKRYPKNSVQWFKNFLNSTSF